MAWIRTQLEEPLVEASHTGAGVAPFNLNLHDDGNGMSGDQSDHAQGNCASSFIFCAACIICACPVNIIALDAGGDEENAHGKGEHSHRPQHGR